MYTNLAMGHQLGSSGQDDVPASADLQELLLALPLRSGPRFSASRQPTKTGAFHMGVPLVTIHGWDFPWKSLLWGDPHDNGNPPMVGTWENPARYSPVSMWHHSPVVHWIQFQDFFKQSTTRLYFILDKNYVPRREFDFKKVDPERVFVVQRFTTCTSQH